MNCTILGSGFNSTFCVFDKFWLVATLFSLLDIFKDILFGTVFWTILCNNFSEQFFWWQWFWIFVCLNVIYNYWYLKSLHLGLTTISRQTNDRASAPPLFAHQHHQTAPATFEYERDTSSSGCYSYSAEGLSKGPPRVQDPRDRLYFRHPGPCSCPDCKEIETQSSKRRVKNR